MKYDERMPFLRELVEQIRAAPTERAPLYALLRRYGIPVLDDVLRERCARCRVSITPLLCLSREQRQWSAHSTSTLERSIALCPALSTLILKTLSTSAERTHGHHFRERSVPSYEILSDDRFLDLIAATPQAFDEARPP